MTRLRKTIIVLVGTVTMTALAAGQGLEIDWHSIDGGGIMFATGGDLELGVTIGQPDAGVTLTGGGFELVGGYWAAAASPPPPCPGDVNGDGVINLTDLSQLLAAFGSASGNPAFNPNADFDQNGVINLTDLSTLLASFGLPCP